MSQERLEASLGIDRASTEEIVRIIQEQDATIPAAMRSQATAIARAIDAITDRLRHGGRLFYAGAGTSGRIARLDAAEIPPTYNTPPDLVQVLMAGGEKAFFSAAKERRMTRSAVAVNARARARLPVGIAASEPSVTVAAVRRANSWGLTVAQPVHLSAASASTPITPEPTGSHLARACRRARSKLVSYAVHCG